MGNILIIEGEENLARFVELKLKQEGYQTTNYPIHKPDLEFFISLDFDVILIDLDSAEINGLDICFRIRQRQTTPIILLTSKSAIRDRVLGLEQGADDYLVKPFAIEELTARIRSIMRRVALEKEKNQEREKVLVHRDLLLDKKKQLVYRSQKALELTKREYELLLIFMGNPDIVLSRQLLLNKVWGYETQVETNVVDVYIRYLRNKLKTPDQNSYIETVRGKGYILSS